MNALRLELLRPHQRARLAAIEAAGLSQPGTRLFMETLGFPQACRMRACRRTKTCLAAQFYCITDNREFLLNEVFPAVVGKG
jgi:hypothetical protein